ncbi:MAG: TIGR03915 family putative DNA repair protein [Lachnospiraceae bacterium]|nr:TIGR03915 family putative DNA repair protein [Lachnospiraceae bacterium]
MKVFCCEDRFEDMLTCIYDAWSVALTEGHENVRVVREPVLQQTLFDEYIHVEPDRDKLEKVIRSIKRQISNQAYMYVFYASLSSEEDALQAIYNFLRVGFAVGGQVCSMYTNPHVMRMVELKRRIGNEGHYFREFARFTSLDNKVYVCHIEPKNNVVMMVGNHFADRMPSEHWMIIDDTRKLAVVHPKDEENYLRYLTDTEFESLSHSEDYSDKYTDMWKSFFDVIAIKERKNISCQRNMFPIWMRKHAVEFMDD